MTLNISEVENKILILPNFFKSCLPCTGINLLQEKS